jgi:hypothetical protein
LPLRSEKSAQQSDFCSSCAEELLVIFSEMARRAWAKGYRWADLSLTSEDNPNTPLLAEHLGAKLYKRYRVYRLRI